MDELLDQFLIEGPELVQQATADLLELERTPEDRARVDSAFRAVHTLKGSAGLFDLPPLGEVLHTAEDVLEAVRGRRVSATSELIDALLATLDRVEAWLQALSRDGRLPPSAEPEARRLVAWLEGHAPQEAALSAAGTGAEAGAGDMSRAPLAQPGMRGPAVSAIRYAPDRQAFFRGDDPLAIARSTPGLLHLEASVEKMADAKDYDPFACVLRFEILSSADPVELATAFRLVQDQVSIRALDEAGPTAAPAASSQSAGFLRVDSRRVDALAALADELIVAKNGLLGLGEGEAAPARLRASIDRLAGALHGEIMGLRLVPLSPVLRRLERQARELAQTLGKSVDLQVRGHAVEADKGIAEGLYEPLLHLVRNALDHGVETPGERRERGKPGQASVTVSARVVGDEMEVAVADDGRGLDAAALRQAALERGVVDPGELAQMSDEAALELIFAPGFSTARAVTAVSGRGVGMDAVRSATAALGGRITVSSEPGLGATMTLRLPLRAVLTRVLVVESGGEAFGIPLADVRETARIGADDILQVARGRAIVLRQEILPYVALAEIVASGAAQNNASEPAVLVMQGRDGTFALGVDRVGERLDVVLKPVTGLLSGIPGALGTALLGDGRLLVVLEAGDLVT